MRQQGSNGEEAAAAVFRGVTITSGNWWFRVPISRVVDTTDSFFSVAFFSFLF